MSSSKLNLLLLPLLIAVLLSTLSKIKIGRTIDNLTYAIFSPIQTPVSSLKYLTNSQLIFFKNIPGIYQDNQAQKTLISSLQSENQNLKNLIQDKLILDTLKSPYKATLPIRFINQGNLITATTSLDTSLISIGQPVISGSTLVGIVSSIKKPIITITPLTEESFPNVLIKTGLGQTGSYQYSARTTQIINIPSENPVSLNDVVFTEASEKIPANLVVGKITKILTSSQSPLQKAEIKLDLDPTQIKNPLIVLQP